MIKYHQILSNHNLVKVSEMLVIVELVVNGYKPFNSKVSQLLESVEKAKLVWMMYTLLVTRFVNYIKSSKKQQIKFQSNRLSDECMTSQKHDKVVHVNN